MRPSPKTLVTVLALASALAASHADTGTAAVAPKTCTKTAITADSNGTAGCNFSCELGDEITVSGEVISGDGARAVMSAECGGVQAACLTQPDGINGECRDGPKRVAAAQAQDENASPVNCLISGSVLFADQYKIECSATPATAAPANGSDCSYTDVGSPFAGVETGRGMTDSANAALGACVNAPTPVGTFQGGSVEVGLGNGTEPYAVIDGDNENADPLDAYGAVSGYESSGSRDSECSATGPDQGTGGSNSGGCFGIGGGPWFPVPLIACGNTSGNMWANTTRDGCSIP